MFKSSEDACEYQDVSTIFPEASLWGHGWAFWALKCTGFSHTSNKRLHILHTFTGFIGFLKASLFRDTSCYEHCIPNLVWHHHDFRHFLRGSSSLPVVAGDRCGCAGGTAALPWPHRRQGHKTIQRSSSSVVVGYESQFFLEQTCFRHRGHRFTLDVCGDFGSGCNNGFVEYQPNKKQTST